MAKNRSAKSRKVSDIFEDHEYDRWDYVDEPSTKVGHLLPPVNDIQPHQVSVGCWCHPVRYGLDQETGIEIILHRLAMEIPH